MNKKEYLLNLIQEESAELCKELGEISIRASKCLRFGCDEIQEGQKLTNLERLKEQLKKVYDEEIDLDVVLGLFFENINDPVLYDGVYSTPEIIKKSQEKIDKIYKYQALSVERKCLSEH